MLKQFLKFSLIGISNGAVNFCVYNLCLMTLRALWLFPEFDYLIALAIGFMTSVLWSFCLNRRFVFCSAAELAIPWQQALLKMYMAYSFTGLLLSPVLSILWVQFFGIPKEYLPLINDLVGFPINFLLNKFWSFKTIRA